MIESRQKLENRACILTPVNSVVQQNRGLLEVVGWYEDTLLEEGFELNVSLGKRVIRSALADISAASLMERDGSACCLKKGDSRFHFFRKEVKIGKGLKRLTFSLQHKDGRCLELGKRLVYQTDKVDSVSEDDGDSTNAGMVLSEYGQWLVDHEPKLRSSSRFQDGELMFPVPLVWVIEVVSGELDRLMQTLLSAEVSGGSQSAILLVDRFGVFESGSGKRMKSALETIPGVKIELPSTLNLTLATLEENAWIGFLSEGDWVERHFYNDFCHFVAKEQETEFLYTDYDHQLEDGALGDCHVSPAWNRDLLQSYPYIGKTFLMKSQAFQRIGGFEGEGIHRFWALQLKFARQCKREHVGRLCGVYFHLKEIYQPHSDSASTDAGTALLESHHQVLGQPVEVSVSPGKGGWRTRYFVPEQPPKVSLLIPTRDGVSVLRTTVDSVLEKTRYPNYEILILDNDSELPETMKYFDELREKGCRIISCPGKFNYSQINNRGTMEAKGEILGFLNNDLEVIDGGWLTELVAHACRADVGAVGPKLLYPDGTIQHAGVLIGVGHVAAHAFRLFEDNPDAGPLRAHLIQNYSAVTAACLLVRSEIFKAVGGFDDVKLAITNNDVDLCIKIREAGYRNVYTPHAVLYHHESATRGPEDTPEKFNRYQKEVNHMWKQWSEILLDDPAYNSLLTRFKEDFSLARTEELEHYVPGKIF